jgi:VanZ family protein
VVRLVSLVIALLALAAIAVVTVGPIGIRPNVTDSAIEHVLAFALVGMLFGVAFPRQVVLMLVLVTAAAIGLEVLQFIEPTRHPRLVDLGLKIAGGVLGVAIGVNAPQKPGTRG